MLKFDRILKKEKRKERNCSTARAVTDAVLKPCVACQPVSRLTTTLHALEATEETRYMSWPGCILGRPLDEVLGLSFNTIQYKKIVTRSVCHLAESEAQAVASGKWEIRGLKIKRLQRNKMFLNYV